MKRLLPFGLALALLASMAASASAGPTYERVLGDKEVAVPLSGMVTFGARDFGPYITECPQAGLRGHNQHPVPLDQREKDRVEQLSRTGDDVRANTDYSCFPQNETSVAVNPLVERNLVSGQNDYRTLARQGFNSTTDNGNTWYSEELPPPSVPDGDVLDASGDPVYVFDRDGVVYSSSINFNRTDDENGIMVQRSTNGGFTWTRACVPIPGDDPADPDEDARCGSRGDPRQPGDGVVTYFDDPDNTFNFSQPFDDKEWMAAGPRPAGVEPVCFTAVEREATQCDPAVVGVDRLYVTWTRFELGGLFVFTSRILLSYSDDQGRSWSPPRSISGSAPFCTFSATAECDLNQFSVPTVHPTTGLLGVAFENFNTEDENQYLFVRSDDGGTTFEGPYFITPVFDVNYPRGSNRPDCRARGQSSGRRVLTNSCFRVNAGGNVVVDKRGGQFADDFYLVMSDNRNGTRASSNTDVFFFRSTDGGRTWIGPSRVNTDRSDLGEVSRDCGSDPEECLGDFGNDQWFPWMDVNTKGVLAFGFHDRRLDTDSVAHEWPTSRERPGNYLAWFWGAGCRITRTAEVTQESTSIPPAASECLAPGAQIIPQPGGPVNPGDDPVPGQGAEFVGPFANQVVSDVPHNLDYSFRAGIFMGDYNAVAYPNVAPGAGSGDRLAVGFWTDSRNGRGSGSGTSHQPGRNPACEQADVFLDFFNPLAPGPTTDSTPQEPFLVTPCPVDANGRGG